MKITIDSRMINSSGIGTYLQNLLPFLIDKFDLTLLGYSNELREFDWIDHVKIIEMKSQIYSIKEQFELAYRIPKSDIFWSPHYNIPILPTKAKKRIVTIHDVFHLAFYDTLSIQQKLYAKYLINQAIKRSEVVVTVSNFTKQEIKKYIADYDYKIKVIYNGIDRRKFNILQKDILQEIAKKYDLPNKFILFVGNVKPHKNLKKALLAFKKVLVQLDYLYFVIVGRQEGFITGDKAIFKIIQEDEMLTKRVKFTGYINNEDLPAIYNLASLLVFPSIYEGFGMPPLEAMACGCPVLASNSASIPEVCGEASYYVNPDDVESIAEGIHKILADSDMRSSLIQKGFERVKLFNWEKSANEVEKIFELIKE